MLHCGEKTDIFFYWFAPRGQINPASKLTKMHNTDRPTESVTCSGFWFDFLTSLHTYLNKHA